jgi:hypothetical protein
VGTFVGVLIFMTLLLVGVQVLVRLYATSALTSAAFGAADRVATDPSGAAAVPAAQAAAVAQLGSWGAQHTIFTWEEVDAEQVVLQVRAVAPGFVPIPGLRDITRVVTVRTERFR